MAFFDHPGQIVKYLQQTWTSADDTGLANIVLAEALSPLPAARRDFNPSFRAQVRPVKRGDGAQGTSRRGPGGAQDLSTSPEINMTNEMSMKERANPAAQPDRVAQPTTKTISFKDTMGDRPPEGPAEGAKDMFVEATIQPPSHVSGLAELLRVSRANNNPYMDYAKFNGDGHQGAVPTFRCKVFLPPSKPGEARRLMQVSVLRSANVRQFIGLILWRYNAEDLAPPTLTSPVDRYELRDVDDGEPDMDFPPLPPDQPMSKFGFDVLALCELAPRTKEKAPLDFVKIHVPKQGTSILKLSKTHDITIGEILAMVQKKRALPLGQHTLELESEPGVTLDMDRKLRDMGSNEFMLIHLFSKRFDSKDDMDKAKEREVENSLRIYQYESYIVYKRSNLLNVFGGKDEVMLNVDGDKLSVIPYGSTSTFPRPKEKLVSYMMDNVVHCSLGDDKNGRAFKFVVPSKNSQEYKAFEFEAKDPEEASKIVKKILYILESRPSEVRSRFELSRQTERKR